MLYKIFGLAGVLCTLYFVLLVAVGMDFCWIWLAAALFFFGILGVHKYGIWQRMPSWSHWLFIGLFAAGMMIFAVAEGQILSKMTAKPKGKVDYMIILGAQVREEKPSKALTLRMQKALELWESCGEPTLLLSGGQGDGESITEAECTRRFLTEQGIPKDKMILEDRSVSTQENLRFCAELTDCKEKKTAIVSNNFHIYRALKLAEKQGYQNVCGIAAESDWRYQIHYMVREAFALVKEKLSGNID